MDSNDLSVQPEDAQTFTREAVTRYMEMIRQLLLELKLDETGPEYPRLLTWGLASKYFPTGSSIPEFLRLLDEYLADLPTKSEDLDVQSSRSDTP